MIKIIMSLTAVSFLLLSVQVQAESRCYCGTYRYNYKFAGNSTNHYRLIDGVNDVAIVADTEKTSDGKYVSTEIQMTWPGSNQGYIPAYDQLADDAASICVKGKFESVSLMANPDGVNEKLTYFEYIENIYPAKSKCLGEPISINLKSVKKAKLPD